MAVFPDKIVLKSSTDDAATIIAAIGSGGADAIQQGEVVVGRESGAAKLYTIDASGNVVTIGGTGTTLVSDTAPTQHPNGSPLVEGDTWMDSTDASFHVYYGNAWVQVSGGGGGAVVSVNGQTGVVALDIEDLNNVGLAINPASNTFLLSGPTPAGAPSASGEWTVGSVLNNFFSWYNGDPIETWLASIPTGTTVEFVTQGGYVHSAVNSTTSQVNSPTANYMSFAGYPWPQEILDAAAADEPITVRESGGNPYLPPTDGQVLTWVDANSQWEPVNASGGGAVDSVNSQTGVVSLGVQDMNDYGANIQLVGGLVLYAEGPNGTTAPDAGLDSSSYNRTQSGSTTKPTYSTSVKKFGTSSFQFSGANQFLAFPNNADGLTGTLLTDDFTVECWARFDSFTAENTIFFDGNYYNNNFTALLVKEANATVFTFHYSTAGNNGATKTFTSPSLSVNTWYHVALCRSGNTVRLFVDGVETSGTTTITGSLFNNTSLHRVGVFQSFQNAPVLAFHGFMDEYRVADTALYTSNFTPSQIESTVIPPIDGQVLTWVDANSQWEAVDAPSGGGGLGAAGSYLTETQTAASGAATFTGLGHSGLFRTITSDLDAWVVFYGSAADRTADAGRPFNTAPATSSGVLAEVYVTAATTLLFTPGTSYFNNDTTPGDAIYVAVRDQAGANVNAQLTVDAFGQVTTIVGSRQTVNVTTASIADAASDNVTLTGTGAAGDFVAIETDKAAWVVVYSDTASRTADSGRAETTAPASGSGVLLEVVTTGAQRIKLTPHYAYFNDESTPASEVYLKVTNKSGSLGTVTVTATVVPGEN
jgi:hypothetical protein